MSVILENILKELEELTAEESLVLLTRLSQHLQHSLKATTLGVTASRRVEIPGAYRPTAEQVTAHLKAVFSPEQLAEIEKVDLSNLKLPPGAKTTTEILSEDREDRF